MLGNQVTAVFVRGIRQEHLRSLWLDLPESLADYLALIGCFMNSDSSGAWL